MSDIIIISDDVSSPDKSPPGLLTKAEFAEINSVLGSPAMSSSSTDNVPQRLDRPSSAARDIPTGLTSGSTKEISRSLSARTSEKSPSFAEDDFGDMPPLLSQLRAFPEENTPQAGERSRFSKADVYVSQHNENELDGILSDTKPVVLLPDVTSDVHAEKVVVAPLDTRRATSRLHDHRTTKTSDTGPRPQRRSNQFSPLSAEANFLRINPPLPNLHVNDSTATSSAIQDSSQASSARDTGNEDTLLDTPSSYIAEAQYPNVNVTLSLAELKEFGKLVVKTRKREGLTQVQLALLLRNYAPENYEIKTETVSNFESHRYSRAHMLLLYPMFKRWTEDRSVNEDTLLDTPSNCAANAHTLSFAEMKEFRKLVRNTRRSEGLTQNQLASLLRESNPDRDKITFYTVVKFETHRYNDTNMSLLYPVFKNWLSNQGERKKLQNASRRRQRDAGHSDPSEDAHEQAEEHLDDDEEEKET